MTDSARKALARLGELLSIDIDGWGQDWELVYADPERIEEFCEVYERESLNPVEAGELMRLIVASYDQALEEGAQSGVTWERIARLLKTDFILHREVVEYWSLLEEPDADNVFPVTPLMREVWRTCNSGET
jgi:hypothetical protein